MIAETSLLSDLIDDEDSISIDSNVGTRKQSSWTCLVFNSEITGPSPPSTILSFEAYALDLLLKISGIILRHT